MPRASTAAEGMPASPASIPISATASQDCMLMTQMQTFLPLHHYRASSRDLLIAISHSADPLHEAAVFPELKNQDYSAAALKIYFIDAS